MYQPLRKITAFLILALLCAPARAAILRVKADASGPLHDGMTWGTAYTSVPAALAASTAGDEIWVAAGEYRSAESVTLNEGVSLYGGFNGAETGREQRDPKTNVTTLRPLDTNITVVTAPTGVTAATVLDGFTITGGRGTARDGAMYGGGVLCDQSSPTISHNLFTANAVGTQNTVAGYGGGIAVLGGSPMIEANTFTGNNAAIKAAYDQSNDAGGGADIACIGGAAAVRANTLTRWTGAAARVYLADTTGTVSGNRLEGQGIGIQIQSDAAPTIQNNVIQDSTFWAIRCRGGARITGNTIANVTAITYPNLPVGIATYDSAPLIEGNSITGFDRAGIIAMGGAPEIAGNTVATNGGTATTYTPCGIQLDASAAFVRGNIIRGNSGAGIVTGDSTAADPGAMSIIVGNSILDTIGPAIASATSIMMAGNEIAGNQATGPAVSIVIPSDRQGTVAVNGNRIVDNATLGALRILNRSGGVEVMGNEVLRNSRRDGITVSLLGGSVVLQGNRMLGNMGTIAAASVTTLVAGAGSGVRDNLIARNTLLEASSGANALVVHGYGDIVGNTIADNSLGLGNNYGAIYTADANVIANNIVAFNRAGIRGDSDPDKRPTVSHNLVYGNEVGNFLGIPDSTGTDGNLSANPMFVDRAAGDYRLLTGSPAINVGDDALVEEDEQDVDGNPRIIGAHTDIGAFEYVSPDPLLVAEGARALRIAAGFETVAEDDLPALDADASGAVDIRDAAHLMRRATGQES